MYVLHKKDNRYCDALDRLGKLLSHTFDVHCIERPKLREVQVFDNFYTDFENEIGKIKKGGALVSIVFFTFTSLA